MTDAKTKQKKRVKVFWVEEYDQVAVGLRRFSFSHNRPCPESSSGCSNIKWIGEEPALYDTSGILQPRPMVDHTDPRWPTNCKHCDRAFTSDDEWQVFQERIYLDTKTGNRWLINQLPAGACYDAHWYPWKGPDGRSLVVILPDGSPWSIDGKAANCTKPQDRKHWCWVRHGSPEEETLHVDKDGNTCSAGGGSIHSRAYHGHLHHGYLIEC